MFISAPGEDLEHNEAIKIILAASGFEVNDSESVKLLSFPSARNWKQLQSTLISMWASKTTSRAEQSKGLQLSHFKPALNEADICTDRPDVIVEQSEPKMTTRRKTSKQIILLCPSLFQIIHQTARALQEFSRPRCKLEALRSQIGFNTVEQLKICTFSRDDCRQS
jgi:hypothetical protein